MQSIVPGMEEPACLPVRCSIKSPPALRLAAAVIDGYTICSKAEQIIPSKVPRFDVPA